MQTTEILDRFRELRDEADYQELDLSTDNLISLTIGSILYEALHEVDRSLLCIAENVQ